MPRSGYKSITVKEKDFTFFKKLYEDQQDELRKRGVTTFSGFITRKLYEALELDGRNSPEA